MELLPRREDRGPDERVEPSRSDALWRWARAEVTAELCWWWLLLVVGTAVAKLAYLDQVYPRNLGSAIEELLRTSPALRSPWLVRALILARDMLQTAALAALVFAFTAKLPVQAGVAVRRVVALALLVVLGANHVSFLELGTFVSKEALVTSWVWVSKNPASLNRYLTPATPLAAAASALWVLLPTMLVRAATQRVWLARVQRALVPIAGVVVGASLALVPIASAQFGERAFPIHGYWSSMVRATWGNARRDPARVEVAAEPILLEEYRRLAYPSRAPSGSGSLAPEVETRIRPRHVLVVGLETAPRAYYPLTTSEALPTFRRMSERAIVSAHHYTTSPYTRIANFSMLSGLYAPPAGLPARFGRIAGDGFAAVLRQRGYETTYLDSWVLDWLPDSGERAQAQMLGFDTVKDSDVRRDDGVWEVLVRGEEVAFDEAFARIVQAEEHGTKAAVFVGTMLGHAPWPAAQHQQHLDGPARILEVARVFDRLFARLLERLAERGLGDDVLIVVAGDHGLRLADEFRSLGLAYSHSDLAYDVPFLLYAPGLVDHTLRVPFATSHVDITPTLLHLVGVSTEGMLHHGGYVLDPRLAQRVVYLPSSKLGPLDGFTYDGHYVTHHALSGVAQLGVGADLASMRRMTDAAREALPAALRDPASLLDAFDEHTTRVAGALLRRGRAALGPQTRDTP